MPTLFKYRGFWFRIYTHDHPPPHVHIVSGRGFAVVEISTAIERCRLLKHSGVAAPELRRLIDKAATQRINLLAAWENAHGNPD